MKHLPSEIMALFEQMQPCAQAFILDLARKYVLRWPLAPPSSLPLRPRLVEVHLNQVDNVINGPFPVQVRKVIDSK